ncbi:Hypothetical protein ADU72_0242 [Pediococcus damnosus]|uniref:Uncharacterized protein n=1 Tax=Pediococcus damnosus TaxID=51663 RepID=A0AAC9B0F0_9LACO|nr:Hypothetical protein ADU70_0431 [Pediococcus damnosus]AMV66191.1 Hypothetical protein ADU72_0242 [Pediococcus damnosus]
MAVAAVAAFGIIEELESVDELEFSDESELVADSALVATAELTETADSVDDAEFVVVTELAADVPLSAAEDELSVFSELALFVLLPDDSVLVESDNELVELLAAAELSLDVPLDELSDALDEPTLSTDALLVSYVTVVAALLTSLVEVVFELGALLFNTTEFELPLESDVLDESTVAALATFSLLTKLLVFVLILVPNVAAPKVNNDIPAKTQIRPALYIL